MAIWFCALVTICVPCYLTSWPCKRYMSRVGFHLSFSYKGKAFVYILKSLNINMSLLFRPMCCIMGWGTIVCQMENRNMYIMELKVVAQTSIFLTRCFLLKYLVMHSNFLQVDSYPVMYYTNVLKNICTNAIFISTCFCSIVCILLFLILGMLIHH